jgi:SWIM/SEC-C metal-binding protein
MPRLGSSKHPAVVRVQTMQRAEAMLRLCDEHGWKVIVGIEPDKLEDITDVLRLLQGDDGTAGVWVRPQPKVGRNDPCSCGSGLKFKRCCMPAARATA